MRAVRCENRVPEVVEIPEPTPTKNKPHDEVVVNVASAGICGSDLHLINYGIGATFGHEFAGTLNDGTPVAVQPIDPCGQCARCLDGDLQLCVRGPAMAFGVGRDGGMAEKVLCPTSSLSLLPSGVDVKNGSLVEPLAVAVHGFRRVQCRPDETVAVIGGGTIGQMAAVVAQQVGAPVQLSARHDAQRQAAERLGVALRTDEQFDVVVEAAGTSAALSEAVNLCRPGGRVLLLGSYWDGGIEFPGMAAAMREVNLIPSVMYGRVGPSRDFDVAASILAQRPDLPDAVITHRFPLDAAREAFAVASDRSAGAIKVVLEP